MKKQCIVLSFILFTCATLAVAQIPQGFSYQSVLRDNAGVILANRASLPVRFTVLNGASPVYVETHTASTNQFGLLTLTVGQGTPVTGTFSSINWSTGSYSLQVEIDFGSGYELMGTNTMLTVPFAMVAGSTDSNWNSNGNDISSANTGNVGIGTTAPSAKLDVEGSFQLKDGSQANNKILASDADGNASWKNLSAESIFGTGNVPDGDLACLALIGSLSIGTSPRSVAVSGNYAYVVDAGSDDLKVINISNPASPSLSGSLDIGTSPWSVAVSGNYAYVVDNGSFDLKVIDISNPASPSLKGSLGIGTFPVRVAVSGNYAYVIDLNSHDLKVINISNPASPSLSGSLSFGGFGSSPNDVAVSGNYAYVVDYALDELKVINISNPASPSLSGSLGIGISPQSVAVSGNYAYVVDNALDDLKVINISNPASPSLSGSLGIGTNPQSVAVSYNHAYVVDQGSDDLKVINISNPASPSLSGSLGIGTTPESLAVSGNYAFVAENGSNTLKVIRLLCQSTTITLNTGTGEFNAEPSLWTSTGNNMYNANAGNIGIGTIAPSNKLSVSGNADFTGKVGIGTNTPANKLDVEGGLAVGATYSGTTAAPANGAIFEGNVGIGTNTPANKLDVEGGLAVGATYSGTTAAPANGAIFEGNVGIGTSSPGEKLVVDGGTVLFSGVDGGRLVLSRSGAVAHYIDFRGDYNPGDGTGSLNFRTDHNSGYQQVMTMTGLGNVGIGTTTPAYKLTVQTATGSHGIIHTDGNIAVSTYIGGSTGGGYIGTKSNHKLSFFTNDSPAQVTLTTDGNVGIGTTAPASNRKLHVETGTGQVYIHGTGSDDEGWSSGYPLYVSGGNNGILIKVDDDPISSSNDFISFWSTDGEEGRIEGFSPSEFDILSMSLCELNELFGPLPSDPLGVVTWGVNLGIQLDCIASGGDGVVYASGSGDYAECLEKADPNEKMTFGDIVGVRGGKITRNTIGAEQVMSISLAPIVLGKMAPHDSLKYKYEKVAFMGQVLVKVRGKVSSGDYIVADGNNSGHGIAVREEDLTIDMISKIVGRSWENSDKEGLKFVNVVVGVKGTEIQAILSQHQSKMKEMENHLTTLMKDMESIKTQLGDSIMKPATPGSEGTLSTERISTNISIKQVQEE